MSEPIRLDDPDAWPSALRELACRAVDYPGCQSQFTADLELPTEVGSAIDSILAERGIVVYQCARLLDSEIIDIKANGLRACSDSLLADKLKAAVDEGLLTPEQVIHLANEGVLRYENHRKGRLNLVCALTLLRTVVVVEDGVEPLFGHWGGEITYFAQMSDRNGALSKTLRSMGQPVLIEFVHRPADLNIYKPDVAKIVIGMWRRLDHCAGEVYIKVEEGVRLPVLDVWLRDDPRWPHDAGHAR